MKVFAAVFLCLLLASCGAKTRTELADTARLSGKYTVQSGYQSVFKGIADKFIECDAGLTQSIQRNLYTDMGAGEFYLADSSGYVFLIDVKKVDQNSTSITAYSKISIGMYPKLMDMVRYVAEGKEGCPK